MSLKYDRLYKSLSFFYFMAEIQKQNEWLKEQKSPKEQTQTNLNYMLSELKKWTPTKEKRDHMVNYVIKLAEIESKYEWEKENIKKDVRFFIESSLWNRLYSHLWEYNIKKFDVDWNGEIDSEEEKNYSQAMTEAISQIIIMLWVNNFSQTHYESASKEWITNVDKKLANIVNLWKHFLWEKGEKNFSEALYQRELSIKEEELKQIKERKFDITSKESRWDLALLLFKEFWDWVEDILRFLWNIPAWIILLPRYLTYRTLTSEDNLNIQSKTDAQIKLNELVKENPSLWLIELLWEKWVEMIKKLAEMFTSWKQWDIAMLVVTIAWLLAGWAWAAKLWLNLSRKSAVNSARLAWREARIAWETTSRTTRQWLKKWAQKTWKFAEVTGRVDDIVWGAWIGHMTGQFGWSAEKIKNIQESANDSHYHSNFSTEIPESLRQQNPLAWIDKSWEIHYNQTSLEEKFGIKITTENGKTLFDWKTLKDHKQAQEILDYLKELKAHEVTHRILEARGITEIKVWDKIYSQEDICSIVDWSRKIEKSELEALEKALKEKLWDDFRLLKNWELDADFLRRYDTKMVAGWEDVRRKSEAAKVSYRLEQIPKNTETLLTYEWKEITIFLWNNQMIQVIKTSDLPKDIRDNYRTPYLIIQPDLFSQSKQEKWFKWLRQWEPVLIWRNNERFQFWNDVSKNHVYIALEWDTIKLFDDSTNGTFVNKDIWTWIWKKESPLKGEKVVEANNIQRNQEVLAVWDLHGNIEALWGNLNSLWVIDKNKNWIGWDRKLVFQWDILADRNTQWLQILQEIERLKLQAKNAWWDITIIAGNHDDIAVSFLLWKWVAWSNWRWNYKDFRDWWVDQALWMQEFRRFINSNWDLNAREILANMRKSPEWMKILESICSMKLVEQIDDTLFVHTDITNDMAEAIWNLGVNRINSIYQHWLRKVLLEWWEVRNLDNSFHQLVDIFLNTDNRKYMSNNRGEFLKSKGINTVIHGHTDHKWADAPVIGWVLVKSVDNSYGKNPKYVDNPSIWIIRKDGNIQVWAEKLSINWGKHGDYLEVKKWLTQEMLDSIDFSKVLNELDSIINSWIDTIKINLEKLKQIYNSFKEVLIYWKYVFLDLLKWNKAEDLWIKLEKLSNPRLSIQERKDIIMSLPRETPEQKAFIRLEIQRTREMIDVWRWITLDLIESITKAIKHCESNWLAFKDIDKTPYHWIISEYINYLPEDMKMKFVERYYSLIWDLSRQDILSHFSKDELLDRFFWMKANWKFDVEVSWLSVNFKFDNIEDYVSAFWKEEWRKSAWFQVRKKWSWNAIALKEHDEDTFLHESQHVRNDKISPLSLWKQNRWLWENEKWTLQASNFNNIEQVVKEIFWEKLKWLLNINAKDEIIAWFAWNPYNPNINWIKEVMLMKWKESPYDYSLMLRAEIWQILSHNPQLQWIAGGYIWEYMEKYDKIIINMIDVVCDAPNPRRLDELMITPFQEWYKFMPWLTKADFAI